MLTAQVRTFSDLLSSARVQQESVARQVQEYSSLFLEKQQAYNELLQKFTLLRREMDGKAAKSTQGSAQKVTNNQLLHDEVRKRLSDKLNKM